jgi:hypothetical protein
VLFKESFGFCFEAYLVFWIAGVLCWEVGFGGIFLADNSDLLALVAEVCSLDSVSEINRPVEPSLALL